MPASAILSEALSEAPKIHAQQSHMELGVSRDVSTPPQI